MKQLLWAIAVVCCAASAAIAGPNANGVLLVHDTGLTYSTDTPGPPYGGPEPADCNGVDAEAPFGNGASQRIWKVYAAFPTGSSPRLMALAMGMDITPRGGGYISVSAGSLPDTSDFEIAADGWPTTNHGSVGVSFPISGTKTALVTEVYWFAGYAFGGPSGADVQYFCMEAPANGQRAVFVDDAPSPAGWDPIVGYGCLGFGHAGSAPCPVASPPTGACCVLPPSGSNQPACSILTQEACLAANGTYKGDNATCAATSPATACDGACCVPAGCHLTTNRVCLMGGGTWNGVSSGCSPDPCPTGSCCDEIGRCYIAIQPICGPTWTQDGVCNPNPCPQPVRACCAPEGTCTLVTQAACTAPGVWYSTWTACTPNPCPLPGIPGACCSPDGGCRISTQAECPGTGILRGACSPNPCPQPPVGICCDALGVCAMTTQAACAGRWTVGGACTPNPCRRIPTEERTWGAIKNIFR